MMATQYMAQICVYLMHIASREEAQGNLGHAKGLSAHVMPLRAQAPVVQWLPIRLPTGQELDG